MNDWLLKHFTQKIFLLWPKNKHWGPTATHLNTNNYLCDTLQHVFNVWADCAYGSNLFLSSEPFLHLDEPWVDHEDINSQMLESPHENSPWSFHCHSPRFHSAWQSLRDLHSLIDHDLLHPVNNQSIRTLYSNIVGPRYFLFKDQLQNQFKKKLKIMINTSRANYYIIC